jgi:hypothetical protein
VLAPSNDSFINDTNLYREGLAKTIIPLSRPVLGIDPAIWGLNVDQWIPERWLKPLPETVDDAYLPGYIQTCSYSNLSPVDAGADGSRRTTLMGGGRSCM